MADTKVPTYQVKHVDGVMHLSIQPQAAQAIAPEKLRVLQPPAEEPAEA